MTTHDRLEITEEQLLKAKASRDILGLPQEAPLSKNEIEVAAKEKTDLVLKKIDPKIDTGNENIDAALELITEARACLLPREAEKESKKEAAKYPFNDEERVKDTLIGLLAVLSSNTRSRRPGLWRGAKTKNPRTKPPYPHAICSATISKDKTAPNHYVIKLVRPRSGGNGRDLRRYFTRYVVNWAKTHCNNSLPLCDEEHLIIYDPVKFLDYLPVSSLSSDYKDALKSPQEYGFDSRGEVEAEIKYIEACCRYLSAPNSEPVPVPDERMQFFISAAAGLTHPPSDLKTAAIALARQVENKGVGETRAGPAAPAPTSPAAAAPTEPPAKLGVPDNKHP